LRLGLNLRGRYDILESLKLVSIAEERGFEYLLAPEYYFFRDTVSQTAAYALTTKKIRIICVFNPYTRNPALTAMSIASLNEIAEGRVIPCLGATPASWLSKMGIEQRAPLAAMRESCFLIRKLLDGETISCRGKIFKMSDVALGFQVKPVEKILFSVIGPRMLELAGEIGDGVVLTAFTPVTYIQEAIGYVRKGASKAGRSIDNLEFAAAIAYLHDKRHLNVLKSYAAYVMSASNIILNYLNLDYEKKKRLQECFARGRLDEAATLISDDDLGRIALFGNMTECRRRLEEYFRIGVTLPIIVPVAEPKEAIYEASRLI